MPVYFEPLLKNGCRRPGRKGCHPLLLLVNKMTPEADKGQQQQDE